jgi:hypothetical protein
MLQQQNIVALLVHNLPNTKRLAIMMMFLKEANEGVHSIKLNGRYVVFEDGDKAEMYRTKH